MFGICKIKGLLKFAEHLIEAHNSPFDRILGQVSAFRRAGVSGSSFEFIQLYAFL